MWGAAGLTASAGLASWVEMWLLRGTLNGRIGRTGLPRVFVAKVWGAAMAGAGAAWAVKLRLPALHPVIVAALVLGPYGLVFFAVTRALQVPEASAALGRLMRRHPRT